ncbi:EF-hand domain-containing protein [uncultured Desulfosarcina sp.]|uniref:EF-hand domain-containing protein n=1 Tax=uncultured Desulfosarcina sp. TaxID=218289 RepID=UPI0029C6566A|nr:EF-hand domain-containing protein [uncultured Desulfosarcina sp.]
MMSGISGMSGMMAGIRPDPQQMFNRMDKDGSANIDKDELSAVVQEMAERTGTEIDVDNLMVDFDEDGDGVLSQDETHAAMESLKEQMGPPPMNGPKPGGSMPGQEGSGIYGTDGTEEQSAIAQLLSSLSEAEDEEEESSIIQQWIQTLKGENQSYTPVDTKV